MPRHQDNVDVVLIRNPRPLRVLAGDFALDVPAAARSPRWWGMKVDNTIWRTFNAETAGSKLSVHVEISCPEEQRISSVVDPTFGPLSRVVSSDPKMSVFVWKSDANHVLILSLGAELDGSSVLILCKDPTPTDPIWEFRIGDGGHAVYTVDFTAMSAGTTSPQIKSFTATYAR